MKLMDRFFSRRRPSIDDSVNSVLAINKGDGNLSVSVEQIVNECPPELISILQKQGVAKDAIDNFFKILKLKHVPESDWKRTLEEMALNHLELLDATSILSPTSADTEKLKERVKVLISSAEYDEAENAVNEIQNLHDESAKKNKEGLVTAREAYDKQLEAYKKELLASAEASAYNAKLMDIQYRYSEAIKYYRFSIEKCEELIQHSEEFYSLYLACYLINFGNTLQGAAKYNDAEISYLRALEVVEKLDIEPRVSASLNNALAESYRKEGRFDEAVFLYKKSLVILENSGDSISDAMAGIFNNLGVTYLFKREYQKSRDSFCVALKFYRSNAGRNSIDVAYVMNDIANFYTVVGHYNKSRFFLEKSLKIKEKVIGSHHIATINSMSSLARVLFLLKNYDQAGVVFEKTISIIRDLKLDNHPIMAAALTNYAILHYELKEVGVAKNLYLDALAILDVERTQELELSSLLHNLGLIYRDEGNFEDSINSFRRSIFYKEKTVGLLHAETTSTLNALIETIKHTKDFNLLKKIYLAFYRKYKKQFRNSNTAAASILNDLGIIYRTSGQYQEAIKIFLASYRLKEELVGSDHYANITTCNNLAETYHIMKFHDDAELYYLKSLRIIEVTLGKSAPSYISCLQNYDLLKSQNTFDLDYYYEIGNAKEKHVSYYPQKLTPILEKKLDSLEAVNSNLRNLSQGNYVIFGCEEFHAIIFIGESERKFIEYRLKNKYSPFPGLIVQIKAINVAVRFEKSKNCVIEDCTINSNYGLSLDDSSSVKLVDYHQIIQTVGLGAIEYKIKLGFIVGTPNNLASFDLSNAFDDLVSNTQSALNEKLLQNN